MFLNKTKSNANCGKGPVPPRALDDSSHKLYIDGGLKYSEWKSIAERQLEESKGDWSYSDYARLIQNERCAADWGHDVAKNVLLAACITVLFTIFASSISDLPFWGILPMA